jgi:hypothetical protein
METEGSWSSPQESATRPYPEAAESSPHPHNIFHIITIITTIIS